MTLIDGWLGRPESPFGMMALPGIPVSSMIGGGSGGMSPSFGRGTVAFGLLSGGTAASHKPNLKTSYQFQWNGLLNQAKADLLRSFYDGRQKGPYCFVDPSEANFLPVNIASMGLVNGALVNPKYIEWTPTVGAIAPITGQAPPTGLITGVANWTGAGNGSVLWMGGNNLINALWMPPILQGKAHRPAIYARMLSGSASLTAAVPYGNGGGAASTATATAPTVVLSSTWQEVGAAVASSFAWGGNDYFTMKLTVSSSTSPSILLAAPSVVYDDATTASALNPWTAGIGVPRLVIPKGVDSPVGRPGLRDWVMTMAEI